MPVKLPKEKEKKLIAVTIRNVHPETWRKVKLVKLLMSVRDKEPVTLADALDECVTYTLGNSKLPNSLASLRTK